jgi:hypothetical protein
MIDLILNTYYQFVFRGNAVNNTKYEIILGVLYGVKSDWIFSYNCPIDLPIEIIKSGEIVYKIDSDSLNSFALSEYSCSFIDPENILLNLIESLNVDLNNINIEINVEGNILFTGSLDVMSVYCDIKEKQLQCNFKPRSFILNQTDTVINGAINYAVLDILPNQLPIKLTDFINKIYRIVNKDITLSVTTDLDFITINNSFTPPIVTNTDISKIYVDERLFGNYTGGNFTFNDIDNYGTLIKRIAFTLGCVTGLISDNKAVFYPFMSSNKPFIVVEQEKVLNYFIEGIRDKIECIKLMPTGIFYGNYTEISGKLLIKDILTVFLQYTDYGIIPVSYLGLNNQIFNFDQAILNYYKDYFMSKKYCFEHNFELVGIDYNPYYDIEINGKRYTPVEISINFEKFTTKIKAIGT